MINRYAARHFVSHLLFLVPLITVVAWADADQPLLKTQRWREAAFGVSLLPPVDARLTEGDQVLRIDGPRYTIRLKFHKSRQALNLDAVREAAIKQVGFVDPNAVLEQRTLRIAGRQSALLYFKHKAGHTEPWSVAQGFIPVDPHTYIELRLEVDHERLAQVKPIYEAVLNSIEVADPKDVDRHRAPQIQRSDVWRSEMNFSRIMAARVDEQWLRIRQGDDDNATDVGYMIICQYWDKQMDYGGLRVDVQTRIHIGDTLYDTLSNFFLSEDGEKEFWSVKTTTRSNRPKVPADPRALGKAISWAETGVRSDNQITATIEGPSGAKTLMWPRPEKGYLSQVELYLLGRLLPHSTEQTFGFYAYHSSMGKLTFRAERVVPATNGSFQIHSRPSLEQVEQVSRYDRHGKLIKRVLPGGRVMLPSSLAEIKRIWKVRDLKLHSRNPIRLAP